MDEFEKFWKTNKILDVGCSKGWFLLEAKKRGWEVFGFKFPERAIGFGKENEIIMISGRLILEKFDRQDFDVITSYEVIEHINHPHEDLTIIHRLLKTGGLYYCTSPNFNSVIRYYLKAEYNIIEYPDGMFKKWLIFFTLTNLGLTLKGCYARISPFFQNEYHHHSCHSIWLLKKCYF